MPSFESLLLHPHTRSLGFSLYWVSVQEILGIGQIIPGFAKVFKTYPGPWGRLSRADKDAPASPLYIVLKLPYFSENLACRELVMHYKVLCCKPLVLARVQTRSALPAVRSKYRALQTQARYENQMKWKINTASISYNHHGAGPRSSANGGERDK